MSYFPVFMDLQGEKVLMLGAGSVAERKTRLLLQANAVVFVVARQLNECFHDWVDRGVVKHIAQEYESNVLEGARLIFAATGDADLNQRLFADGESRNIPVNVVDNQEYCRFISPAVVDRGPVQIAISTGGSSPVLARSLRQWIERLLPLGMGEVAQAAGELRERARKALQIGPRRRFWEQLMTETQIRSWSLQSKRRVKQQMLQSLNGASAELRRSESQPGPRARGMVYVVGAGPGRADLLTVRGLHILGQADVILHDHLASDDVLNLARRDADRIYVGKRAGRHHCSQENIHGLMLAEVEKGRNVVRLKGGDPFVFGRGGEELEFLTRHGVDYEVVPGITAATGCAAYSGIPLTHRDHAQALTFVTGHFSGDNAKPGSKVSGLNWSGIVGEGRTAVVYMGVRQAAKIRRELLLAEVDPKTPAALVLNGTMPDQRIIHGTVQTLPKLAAQAGTSVPGLLIIGQVASLGSNLSWFNIPSVFKSAA
jgi:uroporphyrin-III C-methyltransferase/precorrin-2 dehydrogenase/sirohydrochlorin ferrochelatase